MKFKLLISLIGVCFSFFIYLFFFNSNDINKKREFNTSISPILTEKHLPLIIKHIPKKTQKINKKESENTCIKPKVYYYDYRHDLISSWVFNNFGFGDVNEITHHHYQKEEELLEAAKSGDKRAMLILGVNYRWYATMTNFQSVVIRPKELPRIKYIEKSYDHLIMEKARYWLMQAALHGLYGGLEELGMTYEKEVKYIEQHEPEKFDLIPKLKLKAHAYKELMWKHAPDFFYQPFYSTPDSWSKDKRLEYEKTLSKVMSEWVNEREKLGYQADVIITPPIEFFELKIIEKNLCSQ